jgi:hypothetical protein
MHIKKCGLILYLYSKADTALQWMKIEDKVVAFARSSEEKNSFRNY